ncbi:MAG: hypothetical protein LW807_05540 [Proteobacteria bacterium]|jgi:hypothetical protein|nr:hypothetical protein [Pseudomonadota bacterium]
MKVSKKMKISIVLSCIVAVVIGVSCASTKSTSPGIDINHENTAKWKAKAPGLFANVGTLTIVESSVNVNVSESQNALVGKVTNPFGIRDDILDYIIINIPESNERARLASVKLAILNQNEIFISNFEQLNSFENQASAAITCLNLPIKDSYKFIKGYDELLRNTPDRLSEQNRIEYLLNGRVISPNFGDKCNQLLTTKDQCDCFIGKLND